MALLGGVQVTRRRYTDGTLDRYGNPTRTATESVLPMLAAFDPGGSSEPVEVGRESVVTSPTLYFFEAPDLTADDDVSVGGAWFAVEGDPATWAHPWSGRTFGTAVTLRRVAG